MKKQCLLLIGGWLLASPTLLSADPVDIQVDRTAERYNLGVSKFKDAPAEVHKTLAQDLMFSRVFNVVKDGPLVTGKKEIAQWSNFGSQAVLTGKVRLRSNGRKEMAAEIYDVATAKIVHKFKKKTDSLPLRVLTHQVANEVVRYYTGANGIFTSKIAFVNDATGRKELYVADYDGQARKRLTNDNSIVILPRISPDGQKLVFTSYVSGNPDLYLLDTQTGTRQKISSKAGLNVSPSWSPNNQELAVTLSIKGPPNIFLMNLSGKIIRQLTDGKGADTAPSFSPDGNQIAFTSDRAGSPHIYVVNLDGSGLRRLTTEGHCDSAAWSPDGATLVYVKGKGGSKFDIYSIEVLTGIERRLTWAEGDNENPAWSPDSRSIIFTSTRRGKSELFIMSADGTDQQPLAETKGQSFTPHWSS